MIQVAHVLATFASLGHLVLMIGSHNWFYGGKHSKLVGDLVHLAHVVFVLAFPLALLGVFGPELTHWLGTSGGFSEWALRAYSTVCLLVLFVWLPLVTYLRAKRREPIEELRVEAVDLGKLHGEEELAGRGHHAFLRHVPGNQLLQVEYVEKTLALERLPPALDGMTILHLSDLHFHGTPERDWYRLIFERCSNWQPDLVAITGDVVDGPRHHGWIIPLLGRLRWKIAAFAILGNHDYRYDVRQIRRRLRRIGMQVLENNWAEIEVRGEKLVVIGHEGPWLEGCPDLAGCPEGRFRLCLSHTPDHVHWARRHAVDLMLAGHVHGGQIRIPPFGSILLPSRLGRRYDVGAFLVPPTMLHVSRGLSGEHPIRINCRPEVTLLTLRRSSETKEPPPRMDQPEV